MPIKSVIQHSISYAGLLFKLEPYKESNRAMIIIEGDQKYLNINDITSEVEKLSSRNRTDIQRYSLTERTNAKSADLAFDKFFF